MSQDAVDLKEVLERVQNDRELLLELLDIFMEDYPVRVNAIRNGLQTNDFEKLRNAAHSLKGASSNISAKKVNAISVQIEQIARMNKTEGIEELLKDLEQAFLDFKNYSARLKQDFKR